MVARSPGFNEILLNQLDAIDRPPPKITERRSTNIAGIQDSNDECTGSREPNIRPQKSGGGYQGPKGSQAPCGIIPFGARVAKRRQSIGVFSKGVASSSNAIDGDILVDVNSSSQTPQESIGSILPSSMRGVQETNSSHARNILLPCKNIPFGPRGAKRRKLITAFPKAATSSSNAIDANILVDVNNSSQTPQKSDGSIVSSSLRAVYKELEGIDFSAAQPTQTTAKFIQNKLNEYNNTDLQTIPAGPSVDLLITKHIADKLPGKKLPADVNIDVNKGFLDDSWFGVLRYSGSDSD